LVAVGLLIVGCTEGDDQPVPDGAYVPVAPVEILVDQDGVPHVFAASDEDAFWAAGYQMATDRLYQMEMVRRRAWGRWSEVQGESALADDKLARLFDWAGFGQADAERMRAESPESWAIATAWVAGVNRRVEEVLAGTVPRPWGFGPDELDFLPERWDPADPVVIGKMTAFGNDLTLDREILATLAARFFPEALEGSELLRPAHRAFTVPPEERPATYTAGRAPGAERTRGAPAAALPAARESELWAALGRLRTMGSNNMAIDGRHTADGRPILAGDPHLGFDFPGVMYALHMNSVDAGAGGTLDVAGFSITGVPGVSLGHTDGLAWTATTCFADDMDVWDVPSAAGIATVGSDAVDIDSREELIRVRDEGAPAGEGRDETFAVRTLPGLGVLLPSDIAPIPVASPGRELLLRWTGFDPGVGKGLLALNRARTRDDFEAAVDQMPGMGFNFVAADADGIAYRVGLRVPDRGAPTPERAAWQVLDGTDAASLWTGAALPGERLPRSRGGERGWIATANNDPFGFTEDGLVDDDPWYYGAFFDPGWRASRLEAELARLTERGDVTREDVAALQTDRHDNLADELVPLLAAAHARVPADEALAAYRDRPELDRLVALLADEWDGEMRRDSPGALVFHAFSHLFTTEVLEDDFSLLYGAALDLQPVYMLKVALLAARRASAGPDAIVEQGLDVALLEALSATAALLTERFGGVEPDGYVFGDMKVSTFLGSYGPGLDMGTVPTDGGETTVNVSPSTFMAGGEVAQQWTSHWGPLERTVTTFAEDGTPEAWIAFPLGNVADPESPHFRDGQEDWLLGRHRRLLFRRAEIEQALESQRTLE